MPSLRRSLVVFAVAWVICFSPIDTAHALALPDEAASHITQSFKTLALAEFNLTLANDLLSKGDTVRLKDVIEEIHGQQKNLVASVKALAGYKTALAADPGAKNKFDAIVKRRKALGNALAVVEKRMDAMPSASQKNIAVNVSSG